MIRIYCKCVFLLFSLLTGFSLLGQGLSSSKIEELISLYKSDIRGPYKDIRWFCKDGIIIPPKESCGDQGGVQRARYRPEVEGGTLIMSIFLMKTEKIWLGNCYSRLIQKCVLICSYRSTVSLMRTAQYFV